MSKKEPYQQTTDIAKYEPTPDERSAVKKIFASRVKTPRVKAVEIKGRTVISLDHTNASYGQALLMEVFATADVDFQGEILLQVANASTHDGKVDEKELNFMVAVIKGIQPRDQVETMLAAQMGVVHSLTMSMATRLNGIFTLPQLDITERALNKLARTFASQVETLKRYRSTGEQKVRVEHVTVNEGGQAIVGNVIHGGAGAQKKPEATS